MLGGETAGLPGRADPRLLLFDLATARQRAVLFSSDYVTDASSASFLPNGSALALDLAGTLRFYNARGQVARTVPLAPRAPAGMFAAPAKAFTLAADGKHAILARTPTQFEFRDFQTNQTVESLEAPVGLASRPATTLDGNLVVAGLVDGRVIVWDRAGRSQQFSPARHEGAVTAVTIDGRGKRIVSIGQDGRLGLWDLATGERKVVRAVGGVRALALSPDGRTLVTGGQDGGVRFWGPGDRPVARHLPPPRLSHQLPGLLGRRHLAGHRQLRRVPRRRAPQLAPGRAGPAPRQPGGHRGPRTSGALARRHAPAGHDTLPADAPVGRFVAGAGRPHGWPGPRTWPPASRR